jgi:hypothetical protein
MDMKYGMWNVRSLYRAGSLMTVVKKISRFSGIAGQTGEGWH